MTKIAGVLADVAGAVLVVLLIPAAVIGIGLPVVLFMRLVLEVAGRLR